MSVRETCAEWQRGIEPHDDPALKGKKDPDTGFDIKVRLHHINKVSSGSQVMFFTPRSIVWKFFY